ncbi:hypothetical protein J1605_010789 [Eschrichtius robustus]|uniref:UDENN FNIP1/2-type domain-containing protein n=1 Tax=Eschrichtius robustus TaxID=9764 RepID=A0AB34GT22_ESCRO|nr:hypothetical protein J1605_010789 [Eschrichtius robustus]
MVPGTGFGTCRVGVTESWLRGCAPRERLADGSPPSTSSGDSVLSWSCSELDLNEIRLIVYQDCERRGRQVLFDSKAVHKIEEVATQVRLLASHRADAKHRTLDVTRSECAVEGGVGVVVVVMVEVMVMEVMVVVMVMEVAMVMEVMVAVTEVMVVVMEVMEVVMVMEVMEVVMEVMEVVMVMEVMVMEVMEVVMEVMVTVTEVMVVVMVVVVVLVVVVWGKTEDVPAKTPARCCQGGGSGSLSSHGSSGGSLPHAKKQLPKYQYTRPASDVNMLGEMMFGSVAMSYKGSTLKIHYIRSPPQLMVSKVFSARMGSFCGSTNNLQDSFEYINQDPNLGKLNTNQNNLGPCRTGSNLGVLQGCGSKLPPGAAEGGPLRLSRSASFFAGLPVRAGAVTAAVAKRVQAVGAARLCEPRDPVSLLPAVHSTPVDMPSRGQSEDRDSGIARSASLSSLLITPFPSPSSSTSSSSSYQRRWLRSQTTSLENGIIPRRSTDETFSLAEETCSSNPAIVRRKKIAISLIFSLCEKEEAQGDFQDFFFSHFPLFESHMNRLKSAIEKAMISCRKIAESSLRVQFYVSRLMEALGEFRAGSCVSRLFDAHGRKLRSEHASCTSIREEAVSPRRRGASGDPRLVGALPGRTAASHVACSRVPGTRRAHPDLVIQCVRVSRKELLYASSFLIRKVARPDSSLSLTAYSSKNLILLARVTI